MCLIGYYHINFFYHQLIFIIWILLKSFFNDKKIHFQKFLTTPKPKIGSYEF
jgi:hypothetical protein